MRKIYRIPIVGYILRVLAMLVKLPKHIDLLRKDMEILQRQQNEHDKVFAKDLSNLQEQQNEQIAWVKTTIEAKDKQIAELNRKIETEKTKLFYEGFDCLVSDCNCLEQLNTQLSIHPTIWGDKKRLQISPQAAVFTCFFNTNSGTITVGDYTYAGSNVSLLAGSHDMFLEGLSRRDAEIKQGCDIVIGKGVWLASGCTILGPCTIGDNAVVAAGAVVTPGTKIPPETVYAGIPAKLVRKIEVGSQIENQHIAAAVVRENGVLFVDGWSEKRQILYNEALIQGHWIVKYPARIYTDKSEIQFYCHKDIEEEIELCVWQGDRCKRVLIDESDKKFEVLIDQDDSMLSEIRISCDKNELSRVFVAVVEHEKKDEGEN